MAELLGLGVGGVSRGAKKAVVDELLIPVDQVNVNTFLGVVAACASKKLLSLYDGLKAVAVALYAYGDPEDGIEWLEAEVEAHGEGVGEADIVEGLWKCPIMGFLRDKVKRVKVTLKE